MFSIFMGSHDVLFNPVGSGIVAVLKEVSGFRIAAVLDNITISLIRNLTVSSSAAIPISAHHRRVIEPKCRIGTVESGTSETLIGLTPPSVISSGVLMEREVRIFEGEGISFHPAIDALCAAVWEEY